MTNEESAILREEAASRRADILRDVPRMRIERLRLKAAMEKHPGAYIAIAIWQRRVDRIEERFEEAGLADDGIERVL